MLLSYGNVYRIIDPFCLLREITLMTSAFHLQNALWCRVWIFFLFCFPTRDEVPANWDGVTLMWLHCKVLMWISSSLERHPVRTYPRILRPNRCFTGDMHCRVYLCTFWDANLTIPVLAVNGWIITPRSILYKLRSVQNTGTCYPGQGWFVRNLGWGR